MKITDDELVDIDTDDGIEDPPEPPPKRGRGRPKKGQEVNPKILRTEQIEEITPDPKEPAKYTLPQPPGAKPQQLAIGVDPVNFFHWWYSKLSFPHEKKSFDWVKPPDDKPQTKPRYKAYWYRKSPKIDPGLVGNKNSYIHVTHNWPFTEEGKPITDWAKGTLALFGTGRYKIELVDYYASRSIANCEFEVFDWAHNPPKLNMDMVVMESPENKVFIQQMRARGIKLPGDDGYKRYQGNEEDDEMATAATEVMSKMTDRLFDKLDKQEQGPAPETSTAVAAMTQMGELVRALVTSRGDDGTKAALMELVRSLKDNGGNSGQQLAGMTEAFKDMLDRMKEQHETSMLAMRDQLKDAKDEVKQLKQQVHDLQMKLMESSRESNKDDLLNQIQRVQEIREMLGVKGTVVVRKPAEDEGDGMPKWLGPVIQMAMPILQPLVQQAMANQSLQQQTLQQGQQQTAQQVQQAPQGSPANQNGQQPSQAPSGAQQQFQQPQVGNNAPSGAVGPSDDSVQLYGKEVAMALFNAYDMFLNMLAPAIVKHLLDPELHGEDLAQAIIDYHGEPVYKQAAGVDQDDLVAAIVANKTIWHQVRNFISKEYLVEFAEHFKNAVKYWNEEGDEVEGEPLKEGEVKVVDPAKVGVVN